MRMASEILKDIDHLVEKYSRTSLLEAENRALKVKLSWAKQCFKQALEVLGNGDGDSRVEYLENAFSKFFEE